MAGLCGYRRPGWEGFIPVSQEQPQEDRAEDGNGQTDAMAASEELYLHPRTEQDPL